jgi:hypothetical protein
MVLRYCRLHGRRWSFTRQCWLPFPEDQIQAIQAYAARLRATTPKACSLRVHVMECDVCTAILRQLAYS